jgi:hypothetical protein
MRATAIFDVLSHWCLVAFDAIDGLRSLGVPVELVLAPINDGGPLGIPPDSERWFYGRGTRAYGRRLRSDWCEHQSVSTWAANAAVLAGGELCGDLPAVAKAVMSEAMERGALFGREAEVNAFVARIAGVDADAIGRRAAEPRVAAMLHRGNERLAQLGADERPTFVLENAIGDRAVLKGMWQREAVVACAEALAADEAAYAAAGAPPA